MSDGFKELNSMMESMLSMLDDEESRSNAFLVLQQETDLPEQIFDKLSSLLDSDDASCKEKAFLTLYNKLSIPPDIEEKIFSLLNDSDQNLKNFVISQILLDWPKSESGEKLFVSYVLNSSDEDLKLMVLKDIRFIETKSIDFQQLLLQSVKSSNPKLVAASLECFNDDPETISPEVIKLITEYLKQDSDPVVRNLSARILNHFIEGNEEYQSLIKEYEASEVYSTDYEAYFNSTLEYITGLSQDNLDEDADGDSEITNVKLGDLQTAGQLFGQASSLISNYLFDLDVGEDELDQKHLLQAIQKSELGLSAFDQDSLQDNILIGVYCNLYLAHFLLDQKDKALEFLKLAEACIYGTHDPLVCLLFGEFYLDENKNLALAKEYIFRAFVSSEANILNSARNPSQLLKAIGRSEDFLENLDSEVQQDQDIQSYLKSKRLFKMASENYDKYHDERRKLGRDSRINWKDSSVEPPGKKPNIKFLNLSLQQLQEAWDSLPELKIKWELSHQIAHNFYWNAREKHDIDKAIEFAEIAHLTQNTPRQSDYLKDCGFMYFHFKNDKLKAKNAFQKVWDMDGPDAFTCIGDEEYLSLIGKS